MSKSTAIEVVRGEGNELLECGCAAPRSHSRKRCAEGRRLMVRARQLLDEEGAARKDFGPASSERHEVMGDRLKAQEEYRAHMGRTF